MLIVSTIPAFGVLGVMALGVILATVGHASKLRGLVVVGLALVFLATGAMILGGYADYRSGGTDPRQGCPSTGVPC